MKTRRALQIIVGVLSLLVVLCILAALACVALVLLFPNMSATVSEVYDNLKVGFGLTAEKIGLAGMSYLVLLLGYVLPAILLLLAGILMFLRDKGKQGKYVAANIVALLAVAILTIFTIVFAKQFVSAFEQTAVTPLPFDWVVRLAFGGVLAVFVIFVGAALGVKPKKQISEEVAEDNAVVTESETKSATYETVAPGAEKQATAKGNATGYVPGNTSVSDVTKGAYGNGENLSPATIDKINKARMLFEIGAITQDEYIKLVNVYLKK